MLLPLLFTASTLVCAALLVGDMLRAGAAQGDVHPKRSPPEHDVGARLLWGLFYVNPDDPRGWVPRAHGLGTTVNFRTRAAAIRFVALLLCTVVSAAALVCSVVV